jgi:hypothetical protein
MPRAILLVVLIDTTAAWRGFAPGFRAPARTHFAYYVNASFCDDVLPRFFDDRLVSLDVVRCEDVKAAVRAGFDAWQHNADVVFYETDDASVANVTVGAGGALTERVLGRGSWKASGGGDIFVNADVCWYADAPFCHVVRGHLLVLQCALAVACGVGLTAVLSLLFSRPVLWFDETLRVLAWVLLLAPPIAYVGAVLPCERCHDFVAVVTHEAGHVLGIAHPDEAGPSGQQQQCGCGASAAACPTDAVRPEDAASIMKAVLTSRSTVCLSADDARAVRTLYGGDCAAPVFCYASDDPSGAYRIVVALAYAFAVAWVFVRSRTLVWRAWRRCRRVRRPSPPPPSPPRRPAVAARAQWATRPRVHPGAPPRHGH